MPLNWNEIKERESQFSKEWETATKELTYTSGSAVIVKDRSNQEHTYYVHTDNLGSIQSISDENGNLVSGAEFSFDPWGNLRNSANWCQNYSNESSQPSFNIIGRGFTGHEHMTEFGLINMNGRVYDRKLGQFIQPDNYIQDPGSSQSFNRFSYCRNNPVNSIDPSGEMDVLSLIVAACVITYNTWESWNNYGREEGLNSLAWGVKGAVQGYWLGEAFGAILNHYGVGSPPPAENYEQGPFSDYGFTKEVTVTASKDVAKTLEETKKSFSWGLFGTGFGAISSTYVTPRVHVDPSQAAISNMIKNGSKEYLYNGDAEHLFFATYWHYQIGQQIPFVIQTNILDLSGIRKSDLKKASDKDPSLFQLNLANKKLDQQSLALGTITLKALGNQTYSIQDDYYNFDIKLSEGFNNRNIYTFFAGLVHGPVINDIPIAFPVFGFSVFGGGPFKIRFKGTVNIKY